MVNFFKKIKDKVSSSEEGQPNYFIPGALVTLLFFLWGFSYGLLDTLNKHFRNVLGITTTQTTYMQVAYFGAYFIFSIPASFISKRFGYKRTIIFGLLLYVIGAFCFYPSAQNLNFGGFVASLFVIACGLATLENCANTYITVLGSPKYASLRINISQGFNGIATVISPIIASYAFFGGSDDASGGLESVKWTYVGVGSGVFLIAVMFCFVKIPEVNEEELMATEVGETSVTVRRASLFSPHLLLGAFTQFMYTGAQVALASLFIFYATEVGHFTDAYSSRLLSYGQLCFTVGRFAGAALMRVVRADHIMSVFAVCAVITNIFIIAMKTTATPYALLVLMFFESIMFPTIFSLGTKDLGRNHKRGSALIIMGVSGGAVLPPVQAVIHDRVNVNISFVIPLIAYVIVFFYSTLGSRWIKYIDEEEEQNSDIDDSAKKSVEDASIKS
ncbi:L-fucose:H+ symporter permease [Backusella circina FSU 941]|nr:L-fucose:H+ symporter permease [Backusella circina FSU 941]